MVVATRARAFEWASGDSLLPDPDDMFSHMTWMEVKADDLPEGLDYFVFACASNVSYDVAASWVRHLLGLPQVGRIDEFVIKILRDVDPEVMISGIEMLWRRRLKSSPNWTDVGRKQTNHVNRVKHRALKILMESQELERII